MQFDEEAYDFTFAFTFTSGLHRNLLVGRLIDTDVRGSPKFSVTSTPCGK